MPPPQTSPELSLMKNTGWNSGKIFRIYLKKFPVLREKFLFFS